VHLYSYAYPPDLHSFPTRRSSDLAYAAGQRSVWISKRKPGRAGLIANSLGGTMPLHLKYRSLRVLEQGAERRNCRCERGLTSIRAVLYFKARRAVPPILPPSSSGLGHLVLSQETGVRFPVGVLAGK